MEMEDMALGTESGGRRPDTPGTDDHPHQSQTQSQATVPASEWAIPLDSYFCLQTDQLLDDVCLREIADRALADEVPVLADQVDLVDGVDPSAWATGETPSKHGGTAETSKKS